MIFTWAVLFKKNTIFKPPPEAKFKQTTVFDSVNNKEYSRFDGGVFLSTCMSASESLSRGIGLGAVGLKLHQESFSKMHAIKMTE